MKEIFSLLDDNRSFEDAVEYFKDKIPIPLADFIRLADEYKAFAFTISGYTAIQILSKFHEEITKAIEDGTTIAAFKESMNLFLLDKGYDGITNFQADNIFRTNIQTAYNVGHYKQMTNPDVLKMRPYWRYDAVNDSHTRPSHLAMDGKVFRADDPIWDTWYPPNGFRCRCAITTLSERQVKERGLKVEQDVPMAGMVKGRHVNILPDPNFKTNPAKHAFEPDVSKYPKVLIKIYEKNIKKQEGI